MRIIVEGVAIDLTKEQIKHIETVKAKRLKELNSFEKVLVNFGFKKETHANGSFYTNDDLEWYAEIYDDDSVWMTGSGLKDTSSFPGGYVYGTPESLIEELSKQGQ